MGELHRAVYGCIVQWRSTTSWCHGRTPGCMGTLAFRLEHLQLKRLRFSPAPAQPFVELSSFQAKPQPPLTLGLTFLIELFHPSHDLGPLVINYLTDADQLRLATACKSIRALVAPLYKLTIPRRMLRTHEPSLVEFVQRYHPRVWRISPGFEDLDDHRAEEVRRFLGQLRKVNSVYLDANSVLYWA
ncbi:hypothetical protein BJ085DRAFT_38907 [Dimargaris cristalligena]|uniref:F-box domain-containing protein n=1 Tax=Dimargaris cristalligena TaxID=215637 RepID=A0A4P9ZXK5_9FUNG|nr:hypothetical protein BJ085DRAFT_38907 [Dimargaris cristalligena]|eukprot:RKP38396.1 hypothetical protein BJ085DRAFT_38907 [Dimargaris cristalligena]